MGGKSNINHDALIDWVFVSLSNHMMLFSRCKKHQVPTEKIYSKTQRAVTSEDLPCFCVDDYLCCFCVRRKRDSCHDQPQTL